MTSTVGNDLPNSSQPHRSSSPCLPVASTLWDVVHLKYRLISRVCVYIGLKFGSGRAKRERCGTTTIVLPPFLNI